ncbi:MAG: class I SAM-dependent methyltransferase [Candidatus Marinimicrobia bacterium]|nr:class I SAM-dependent methyltransferase [Candidatus Neomarinimicrobiota bacterium]MBL7010828.1 class I SAM-dependent methyltransferase [Candidatus Neomarinimicrobiota bacterium]MBL7030124.1 class I SAM-dependent methyltransferase [Candidatus Neomarinimicrobiota bacterium]
MTDHFYLTQKTVNEYIKMAKGFDGRDIIKKLKVFLPEHSSVLELGSGPGVDLEILAETYHVTGSDFSQHFLDFISSKLPKMELLLLNAVTLDTQKNFDCIYSNKVLQHLTNDALQLSIKKQSSILNNGGIVCHSFWKGEECYEMKNALFNHHLEEDLDQFFSPHFEILLLEAYKEMEADDSILLIGEK